MKHLNAVVAYHMIEKAKELLSESAQADSVQRSVVPRRRFGIRLEGGGDTPEEVIDLLRHMANEMEMNPGTTSSTVGGCGHGGHYDVEDRGEHITPETFRAGLEAWMESKRHNNH